MATNIATLSVKFIADTFGLKAGAASAGNLLGVVGKQAGNLGGVFSGLTGQLGQLGSAFTAAGPAGAAVAGALVAVGAAGYAAYKGFEQFLASADRIDKTSKLAERLDLTYESLQRLTFIAGRSDVELGAVAKAMEHMGRTMGSGGMSLEKRFAEQAKRIGEIKDPALRAAEAFRVFGKAGGELIPLLKNFGQDAERFARYGKAFGFAISDRDARNIERMNDAWGDMVYIGQQLADKFVSKFGGPVAAFLENAIDLTIELGGYFAALGVTWDHVGMVALGFLAEMNNAMYLFVGLNEQAAGILTGNMDLIKSGSDKVYDVFTGKALADFTSKALTGDDTARGGFGTGINGSMATGAIRDSQAAAKIINQAASSDPQVAANLATAKNTAATKAAVDKLVTIFSGNLPVLATGGI